METITTKKGQKSSKSNVGISKIIFSSLILLAVIMASGCIDLDEKEPPEEGPQKELTQKEIEELLASLDKDINVDELVETFDTDKDGSYDKYVLTFEREEVAKDLFLDKSVVLEQTSSGSGYSGEIILRFENTGDEPIEYVHREVFSKGFATSIYDIEFSRPPDRIIDEDPIGEWVLSIIEGSIEIITSKVIGFDNYPMDVYTFEDGMSPTEQCDWIDRRVGTHMSTIDKIAEKHNIPSWLLSTVILNELADYDYKDQFQEIISNRGSVGMAQINIPTATKYGLVDVSDEDIQEYFMGYEPSSPEAKEEAIEYITWQRLNQPEYAIEAAARRIEIIFEEANENLDKPWPSCLLNGPIDRDNPYANIRMQVFNERDPVEQYILKKEGLALLVIAAYNDDKIIFNDTKEFKASLGNPFQKREKEQPFFNSINHGVNGMDLFVRTLERCGYYECNPANLSLCYNKKDCEDAGGYWYDIQCNEKPEEDTSAGDPPGTKKTAKWILVGTNINPDNTLTKTCVGFYSSSGIICMTQEEVDRLGCTYSGSCQTCTITETSVTYTEYDVKDGEEYPPDTIVQINFDKPPSEMIPGEIVLLSASITSGGMPSGMLSPGSFAYESNDLRFFSEDSYSFGGGKVYKTTLYMDGTTISPKFYVPKAYSGDEMRIYAVFRAGPSYRVEWVYSAND